MTDNKWSSPQRRSILKQASRVAVVVLFLCVVASSGFVTTAEASCETNFSQCEGSVGPLSDSLSALNLLAWTVLRLGGVLVLMAGIVLFASSRVGMGSKRQATGAIIAGFSMLLLYFAQSALFGIIDFIVSG